MCEPPQIKQSDKTKQIVSMGHTFYIKNALYALVIITLSPHKIEYRHGKFNL